MPTIRSNIRTRNAQKRKRKTTHKASQASIREDNKSMRIWCYAYPGSWLSTSQISRFIAQSGPMSISLVARSTIEFTISAQQKIRSENRNDPDYHKRITGEIQDNSGDKNTEYAGFSFFSLLFSLSLSLQRPVSIQRRWLVFGFQLWKIS